MLTNFNRGHNSWNKIGPIMSEESIFEKVTDDNCQVMANAHHDLISQAS